MHDDVTAANYLGDYRLEITFASGKSGVVDFRKYIEKGGVFKPLANPEFFQDFAINRELGSITWPNGADVAPEALYAEATGEALPGWMDKAGEMQKTA